MLKSKSIHTPQPPSLFFILSFVIQFPSNLLNTPWMHHVQSSPSTFTHSLLNLAIPLIHSTTNSHRYLLLLTIPYQERNMATNGVFDCGSNSQMQVPMMTVAGVGTGSSAAAGGGVVNGRRRGRPKLERELKRKRTTIYRDSGFVPPPIPPYGRLVFLFYKKLKKSDVGNLSRIVLPKRAAETHLPWLADDASMILPLIEVDGAGEWSFKFRYWPNNESRMYVFEGTGPFTRKYRLQMDDYMLIYKDMMTWNYMIRAVKASEVGAVKANEVGAVEASEVGAVKASEVAVKASEVGAVEANEVGAAKASEVSVKVSEFGAVEASEVEAAKASEVGAVKASEVEAVKASEVGACANKEVAAIEGNNVVLNDAGAFDLPVDSAYFPQMEDASFMNGDYSYFSDILNSFSAWDEISDYYYSPTLPNVSFDDIMSSEDLFQVK